MNPETITKLQEIMAPVASKIGEGAEFGWEVVMMQQYVSAVGFFLGTFVAILMFVEGGLLSRYGFRHEPRNSYDDTGSGQVVVGLFLAGVGLFIFVVTLYEGLARIINPEFYAIKFFLDLVTSAPM